MIQVQFRDPVFQIANLISLQITHFASGIYSEGTHLFEMRTINRLIMVLDNTPDDTSFIEDQNEKLFFRKGSIFLVPAFYTTRWIMSDNLKFLSIHFKAEYAPGQDFFSVTKKIFQIYDNNIIPDTQAAFLQENEFVAAAQIKSICMKVCAHIFQQLSPFELTLATRFEHFKEVIDYVIKQGSAQTTVSDLAELMKMRTDIFSRNFTRETGLTPKQFLSRSLVRKACELLKHGKTNREIAVILKFNNEFYFSHFFKKMIGIPPSLYSTQNQ